jgi:hypothetical protein
MEESEKTLFTFIAIKHSIARGENRSVFSTNPPETIKYMYTY